MTGREHPDWIDEKGKDFITEGFMRESLEKFAEHKGIELSDIDAYVKQYPKIYEKYLKVLKDVDKFWKSKENPLCLNCGKEKTLCKCVNDEEQMVRELKEDIGRLKLKLIEAEARQRKVKKINVDGHIKDVTGDRKKQEVRNIRAILGDKIKTYNMYQEAKKISEEL